MLQVSYRFFENEIKLLKISASSEYEALKEGCVQFTSEEHREEEIEWQKSDDYPKDFEALMKLLHNSDMCVNVIEVAKF